jgi:hypothetical protein
LRPSIVIELDNAVLPDLDQSKVEMAMVRAINKISDKARTKAARLAREQVAFPASYVSPAARRLWVAKRATRSSLEATIEGQGRATSLARFSRQKPLAPGKRTRDGSVSVTVSPGRTLKIRRAFIIRLNNNNLGLAVRTDGSSPAGAYKPKLIAKNLWLLYGPSVDQALLAASDGDGIFQDMQVEVLDMLEGEFNRQMELQR